MDRRSYAIGIGVGQFMKERDLSKRDIQKWFAKQNKKDVCDEACPFYNECLEVMSISDDEKSLCDIIGAEPEIDAT